MNRATRLILAVALTCIAFPTLAADNGSGTTLVQNKNVGAIYGWTPDPNAIPTFGCTDDSYARAVRDGIRVGATPIKPYFISNDGKYSGIDYELVNAAAKYAGIDKVTWVVLPEYGTLIPALLSGRIDVIGETIHETPKRAKNVSFTSATYWYGPSMAVQKGNPKNIMTYKDLTKPGLRIGVLNGSGGATFVHGLGLPAKHFKSEAAMQTAVSGGHIDVSIQSESVAKLYVRERPSANITVLTPPVPPALTKLGFTYSRYIVPKGACSLNLALSRALTDLRQHGVVHKILEKYPGYHVHKRTSY